jgi:hypothetical protein
VLGAPAGNDVRLGKHAVEVTLVFDHGLKAERFLRKIEAVSSRSKNCRQLRWKTSIRLRFQARPVASL